MRLSDLTIDPRSLGEKLWLVDVTPAYEYKEGVRTDNISGYRYAVALPERGLEKINVRIDGRRQLEPPEGFVEVRFNNLELFVYLRNGQPQVGARATGVHLVHKS